MISTSEITRKTPEIETLTSENLFKIIHSSRCSPMIPRRKVLSCSPKVPAPYDEFPDESISMQNIGLQKQQLEKFIDEIDKIKLDINTLKIGFKLIQ
jgi:hypothetical protein